MLEKALGIVIRAISSHLIKKAGFTQKTAKTGAVTLIQRFGSALNLSIHFHVLFLDGVYAVDSESEACGFHEIETPTPKEIGTVLHRISGRIARLLARTGFLERDTEQNYPTLNDSEDDVINSLQGSSITYRIAVGPQRGKKVFMLQTLPAIDELDGTRERFLLAKEGGFSLHADVAAKSYDRVKVERLCRYIARPSVSTQRLKLVAGGRISYERVFNIDVTLCRHCQGPVKIIACIEDPQVITRILAHLNQKEAPKAPVVASSGIRAPPTAQIPR